MGRERLRRLVRGEADARPAWLPLPAGFLGRLGGATYADLVADPTRLFNALRDAVRLLGADAAVVLPDPTLLAAAAGARLTCPDPNRLPRMADHPWAQDLPSVLPRDVASRGGLGVALETCRRLRAADPDIGVALAVAGPTILALQLRGPRFADEVAADDEASHDCLDLAGQLVLQAVRAAGEIGADLLVVLETALPGRGGDVRADAWRPVVNLAGFYGMPVLTVPITPLTDATDSAAGTLSEGTLRGVAEALADLPAWALVTPIETSGPITVTAPAAAPHRLAGLTATVLGAQPSTLEARLDELVSSGAHALSTARPLDHGTNLNGLMTVKTWLERPRP